MSTEVNFPVSASLAERAAMVDAWAATRDAILENDVANLTYPQYASSAKGAYLWDADGNRYIDYILGYGPVVLGHADDGINAAVIEELRRGVCISPLWSPRQVELAELMTTVVPGAEQAYFMKTGSDATSAAIRLARIYTGRDKIAKWGYNGWHDWTAPRPSGVPECTRANTLFFEYNNVDSLRRLFDENRDQIAAVIMMTFEVELASHGFFEQVRDVAHDHGAVFVLDEMRSGFRMALGGAQEYFGVQADLSTFSKAMANGYAVSAVTGKRELMEGLRHTHMSSTYYANPVEMAAAIATIKTLRDTDVIERLWDLGQTLQDGLSDVVRTTKLPATVVGYAISPFLLFARGEDAQRAKVTFFAESTRRGVLLHPNHQWFLSAAHTLKDVEDTIAACEQAASIACGRVP